MASKRVPFQVRFDPALHRRVKAVSDRYHIPRNGAYQMLVELGLARLEEAETNQEEARGA